MSWPWGYLQILASVLNYDLKCCDGCVGKGWNEEGGARGDRDLCERRIDSFWASALHNVVFPVPGGPCSSTTLVQNIQAFVNLELTGSLYSSLAPIRRDDFRSHFAVCQGQARCDTWKTRRAEAPTPPHKQTYTLPTCKQHGGGRELEQAFFDRIVVV